MSGNFSVSRLPPAWTDPLAISSQVGRAAFCAGDCPLATTGRDWLRRCIPE